MRTFSGEVEREILQLFQEHKRAALLLVAIPLLYTMLFGALFIRNTLTDVPIAVCNQDGGSASRQLVKSLQDTPEVSVYQLDGDITTSERLLQQDIVYGLVVIPHDYGEKLATGNAATVELVLNNANTVIGGAISRAVVSITNSHSAALVIQNRVAAGWQKSQAENVQLSVSNRVLYNPTGGYIDFFLAALIIHASQIAQVFVLGPSLVMEKKLRRSELRPHPVRFLAAKLLVYSIFGTVILAVCLAIGMGFFDMICHSSGGEIVLLLAAYVTCMTAFALFLGSWVKIPYRTITYSLFYIMPSVLFAGAIWPRSSMDAISLLLSYLMPIGYVANDVRSLLVKGMAWGWEWHMLALLIGAAIFFLLAVKGLKNSLGRGADA